MTRSGAVPGGTIKSTSTETVLDAAIAVVTVWAKRVWVAATSVSPSIRMSSFPAGSRTATLDSVTGETKALVTRSS
jgi:hypothetical protein